VEGRFDFQEEIFIVPKSVCHSFDNFDFVVDPLMVMGS